MKHLRFTALILTLAMLLGMFPAALAEDAEVFSAPVDEIVGEAVEFGDTGLFPETEEIPAELFDAEPAPEALPFDVDGVADNSAEAALAAVTPEETEFAVAAPIATDGFTVDGGVLLGWSGDASVTALEIPASLGVTVIGKECFKDNTTLQSVTLPNGITTIGEGAFLGCTALKKISLPNSLTTINAVAFMNCTALESLALPRNTANFGTSVIEGCTSLPSVGVYPESPALQFCIDNEIAYTLIEEVAVQGVQLSKVSLSMKTGSTATLKATVIPADATNTAISWSSSDTAVVTVKDGVVKAIGAGSAIITAVSAADASKTAICNVTVSEGVAVSNIILSQSELTLAVGATATLTAAVLPANATNTNTTWTSSDPATVSVKDGALTALKAGPATITVASASDPTKAASCVVTVIESQSGSAVTGVALDQSGLSMKVGETWKLNASVQPADAANTAVGWSSSDPSVASIVGGVVTALKPGTTVIAIASVADPTKTAVCSVTVSEGIPVREILLSQETLTLTVNGTATLTTVVLPNDATNKKLVWKSSDTSVATVKDGVITALKPGTATITAASALYDDKTATCAVTVVSESVPVTGLTLDQFRLSLSAGETWKLTPTVLPANASNTAVTWASSDTSVASIVGGVVTALKAGTATITITSVADPSKTAACIVNVVSPVAVTGVKLSSAELALNSGETAQLTATVEPEDASNKNVVWLSSDASVATVNSAGVVSAMMPGKATITATSVANANVSASCTVTVTDPVPVTQLLLSQTTLTLTVGAKATLTALTLPENATNKNLVWSSSDGDVATVKDGVVTARRAGETTITVASTSNPAMAATCAVTVTKDAVPVAEVTLSHAELVLNAGETWKLTPTVLPENASNTAITWASSDATVATVSGGVVTALRPGAATIFVTSAADPGKTAACAVTVSAGIPVSEVYLSQTSMTLAPKGTATLTTAVLPTNASNKRVTWLTNDPEVATVKDGVVTAVKEGTAYISARSVADDTKEGVCKVTVSSGIIAVTGITLSSTELILTTGDLWRLEATVAPADAANTALIWASSDDSVASVSGSVVTAHRAGKAIISVASVNGTVKAACFVTVNDPPAVESIALTNADLILQPGQTWQLTPVIKPDNAADKTIVWATSNPAVATVKNGVVTAVATGWTIISAASAKDPEKVAYCPVLVPEPAGVASVSLTNADLLLNVGDTWQLTPIILPENASDKRLVWTSSNPAVVTVSNGVVAAVSVGQAVITVASASNPNAVAYCPVRVNAYNMRQVVLSKTGSNGTVIIALGETLQLVPQFATVNGWRITSVTSSKGKVAAVSGAGVVTGVSEGKTTITVRTNKKKAKLTVNVVNPYAAAAVAIVQGKTAVMKVGQTLQLNAVVAPDTARTTLAWGSSKTKRATVTPTGLVTALSKGSVTITVRTSNGKKAKIKISVIN